MHLAYDCYCTNLVPDYDCGLMSDPRTIEIRPNVFTIVDFDIWIKRRLGDYRWRLMVSKRAGKTYVTAFVGREGIYLHRLLVGAVKGQVVDHINGDTLDNRLCNLRIVTARQNRANSRKTKGNTSGFKGVTRSGTGWVAQIGVNGGREYLGYFTHAERAAQAYDRAAIRIHGEHAGLNFEHLRHTYRL